MHRLLSALVSGLCLAVALPAPAGEPPASSASEPSYAQTRELIRLGWLDLAERGVGRLADPSEAALARGWLAERRVGFERDTRKQLAGYEAVAKTLDELHKTLPKDERLQAELAKLDSALADARFRSSCILMLDPATSAQEREAIGAAVEAHQQAAIKVLVPELVKAEFDYRIALTAEVPKGDVKAAEEVDIRKRKAFDAYWRASARHIQEMIRFGEFWPAGCPQQKRLGKQIVEFVSAWLKKQDNDFREPLGPETAGVEMFMDYVLGHGWALAGETAKAVEAFNKTIAVDPADMADQIQARVIWTRAVYYKARTLADAAEKSGKKADWKVALEAIDARIFQSLPGTDLVLAIKARILKGKCLGKLGALEEADAEYDRALQATEGVEEPRLPAPAPRR